MFSFKRIFLLSLFLICTKKLFANEQAVKKFYSHMSDAKICSYLNSKTYSYGSTVEMMQKEAVNRDLNCISEKFKNLWKELYDLSNENVSNQINNDLNILI